MCPAGRRTERNLGVRCFTRLTVEARHKQRMLVGRAVFQTQEVVTPFVYSRDPIGITLFFRTPVRCRARRPAYCVSTFRASAAQKPCRCSNYAY